MSPEIVKAMMSAWIKSTVEPMLRAAIEASIPAEMICGAMIGVIVKVAGQAGWSREQIVELVQKHWDRVEELRKVQDPD